MFRRRIEGVVVVIVERAKKTLFAQEKNFSSQ
jgi:hypothetical protein